MMLKSSLPNQVKVNNTIDDVRLRWNLTTIKSLRFTKKVFFEYNTRFPWTLCSPLGDIEGFNQLILESYKSKRHIRFTGFDKSSS